MAIYSSPEAQTFDAYAAYPQAVAQIMGSAQQELLLCERNFSHCDLGSRAIFDALWAFFTATPPGYLRLICFDIHYLSQRCPQFLQLTERFPQRIELRLAHESCSNWQQGFILADKTCLLHRYHFDWPRGEITTDSRIVAMMQQQFNALWEQSSPSNEWQRLYL
ncbi:DUF7931 domain-containing protein [Janthinobacterium sp. B9-8]|uniref:DUF7931 domain-containing protein n=1 Tax=Janthinobacterium sp. B9-8 TaxID=1236179 RepID=UPI00061D0682|nr:hypothetical protein [Janthinobacterium sp. B9-8]AMC35297.1 hypothetical protein VN23_12100 [Janthinobacterium sp. B9-8]